MVEEDDDGIVQINKSDWSRCSDDDQIDGGDRNEDSLGTAICSR